MVRKLAVWLAAVTLGLGLLRNVAFATPTPPYLLVNHATEECAESILGDDCSWCDPPPGWEVVGLASSSQCPDGYRHLEAIDMICRRYENPFCCSGGSHRGNCENMIVHDGEGTCAFVDDVQNCALPNGWKARPPEVDPGHWSCPMAYRWVDPVECLSRDLEPGVPPRAGSVLAAGGLLAVLSILMVMGLVLGLVVARRRHGGREKEDK